MATQDSSQLEIFRLTGPQLDALIALLRLDTSFLPGHQAEPATRAGKALELLRAQGREADLGLALETLKQRSSHSAAAPATINEQPTPANGPTSPAGDAARGQLLDPDVARSRIARTYRAAIPRTGASGGTQLYPLWYGTNRMLIDPSDPARGFSGERDDRVNYGTCRVAVPKSHKVGGLGSPWWSRLLGWTDDRFRLDRTALHEMNEAGYWLDLQRAIAAHGPGGSAVMIVVHGFNVSFEGAALRAAQLAFDLQVPGITAFYSWPSRGSVSGYHADEAAVDSSATHLADFLEQFVRESGATHVHVIAHGMGARCTLRALAGVRREALVRPVPFGQMILAGPDVDVDVFRTIIGPCTRLAEQTTMYVSGRDRGLAVGTIISGAARAGYTPPITVVPEVDTVDVSGVDRSFFGHGYTEAREVLTDIHALLVHGDAPAMRFGQRSRLSEKADRYSVLGP